MPAHGSALNSAGSASSGGLAYLGSLNGLGGRSAAFCAATEGPGGLTPNSAGACACAFPSGIASSGTAVDVGSPVQTFSPGFLPVDTRQVQEEAEIETVGIEAVRPIPASDVGGVPPGGSAALAAPGGPRLGDERLSGLVNVEPRPAVQTISETAVDADNPFAETVGGMSANPFSETVGDMDDNNPFGETVGNLGLNLRRQGRERKGFARNKKGATYFVSSPGAISSDTRDARFQQGKFDMGSMLQMHLRQDRPALVCDISGGQVMVTNYECEDLFQASGEFGRLVQRDIFSLVHEDDRDRFSQTLAYLMVSERQTMDPQEILIQTLQGQVRAVRTEGAQLIGMWWQLDFFWHRDMPGSSSAGAGMT